MYDTLLIPELCKAQLKTDGEIWLKMTVQGLSLPSRSRVVPDLVVTLPVLTD